jgi:DNA replication and repair protein RecF
VAQGQHEVKMYWSTRERSLTLDSRPVRRLAEYLGVLRTVVFCTEDLMLIKGPARARRRLLDLLLSQTHPTYIALLQRYTRALRSRNALLKSPVPDQVSLESFSRELVSSGNEILRLRRDLVPTFSPIVRNAYAQVAGAAEDVQLTYEPGVRQDFEVELAQSHRRESSFRSTVVGPHRDEIKLSLNDKLAAQFGSEGQKRTLAIALKMAQAEYLSTLHGSPPVLLIDDVMGELDVRRRSGLLPLLERAHQARGQVFMTATEENWPKDLSREVQRWQVRTGNLQRV